MSKDSDKLYGVLGSIAFHLIIVLILAISVLRANEQEHLEIPVVSEDFLAGGGSSSPAPGGNEQQPAAAPVVPRPTSPPPSSADPVVTQDDESIAIAAAKRKQEAEERRQREAEEARLRAEEAERARQAEAERRQQADISNRVSGAFGRGSGTGSGTQGSSTGSGAGDNPFGNSGSGTGSGNGTGYSLAGRSLEGGLPRPQFPVPEEGTIVIDITVDPQGNVISATIGRGTQNITSENIRQSAINAARKAKFNPVSTGVNQLGTITYRYEITR